MPLKISALNCFGVCTDSQNRGNSVDHHIYTSHYLRFEHGFLHVLRICFCRDSSLFCRDFSLFCHGFFFALPWVFFILPWVVFILPWLCLCCRDFNYIAVVLFFLPWQLWATVELKIWRHYLFNYLFFTTLHK